jgi:hypothetical protein
MMSEDETSGRVIPMSTAHQPSAGKAVRLKDPNELRRLQGEARREFKDWKNTLKRMIDRESKCLFDSATGSWSFELPGTLTQLVVETLIRARVNLERQPNKKEAIRQALGQLRRELDLAASAVLGQEDGAKQADPEAEEREAQRVLEQYRAELIRSQKKQEENDAPAD